MKHHRIMTAIAIGLAVTYVSGCTDSEKMTKAFGGRENVQVVRHATKVEVYRVQSMRINRNDEPNVAGYPILAGPVTLDAAATRHLAADVTDSNNYQFEMAKACMFVPGYAARFTGGDKVIEVAFCFHCNDVLVGPGGGMMSMTPGRDRLLADLKVAFSTDSAQ